MVPSVWDCHGCRTRRQEASVVACIFCAAAQDMHRADAGRVCIGHARTATVRLPLCCSATAWCARSADTCMSSSNPLSSGPPPWMTRSHCWRLRCRPTLPWWPYCEGLGISRAKQSSSPPHHHSTGSTSTIRSVLTDVHAGAASGAQVDLDSRDAQRDTPLHIAARRGHAGIIELLLAKCAHFLPPCGHVKRAEAT